MCSSDLLVQSDPLSEVFLSARKEGAIMRLVFGNGHCRGAVLERSVDLLNWISVFSSDEAASRFSYRDDRMEQSHAFYRLVLPNEGGRSSRR